MLGKLDLKKIGWRLARLDKHLFSVISRRVGKGGLSDLVAETKKNDRSHPIRKNVEDERLATATAWAVKFGVDQNFSAALMYNLISESCREQSSHSHEHKDPIDEKDSSAVKKFYRDQLLHLTRDVAANYDDSYVHDLFGTRLYLEFEQKLLENFILKGDDNELALDLGCATGRIGLSLEKKFQKVIGYDISPEMIAIAEGKRIRSESQKTTFQVHDLETGLPLSDDSVSAVVMNMGTLSDIMNIELLLSEIRRVLKPRGKFFFSFYNSGSLALQFGFLPWPTSLAAMIDREKNVLDVRVGPNLYQVHARPYSVAEINEHLTKADLKAQKTYTFPTISSVLPDDIMSTDSFAGYGENHGDRSRPAILKNEPNLQVQNSLRQLDLLLSESELSLGSYILAIGNK